MKALRPLPAVGVLVLCSLSIAYAAEVTMERPFGGPPPPKSRKMERSKGTICKTATITCELQKAQSVGTTCTCTGSDGKPISGKVDRSS